ncbi:MAG TPA: tetratricopeptide repeat protein, partial [Steroidobacter sp.]|nr:tetratricopeptide repeat protein [Steroidobacter sp.]
MSATPEPVGTLEIALAHTRRLLDHDPSAAAEQAREILKVIPRQPLAQFLLGLAHSANRQGDEAIAALRRAVELQPDLPDAWRTLADHLTAAGDAAGADFAYAQHIRFSTRDPRLLEAGAALAENRIAVAEALLREHLKQHPTDVAAIRMFAEVAARLGRYPDAEVLLERCLELAPGFTGARHNYAYVLQRQNKLARSMEQLERLLAAEPRNPGYRNLLAAVLGRVGDYDRAMKIYAGV